MDFTIRKARLEERGHLQKLIAASARGLSKADYSDEQVEAAIATVFGVDSALIDDGTYFVAEQAGELIGCGGWSKRKTLFGGDQFATRDESLLDPESEPAKVRAFFIHPDWARQGVARAILARCEEEARRAGFSAVELMATLPGIKFYEACGYDKSGQMDYEIAESVTLPLVPMRKDLV